MKNPTSNVSAETYQRFHTLVQGVRDYAIYMLDPDGNVTNWNSGAALIKGYTRDEIVGQHFSRFYTAEDQANGEPQRSLDIALRDNTYQTEGWRVRKDGSMFWASVVIDPIYDDTGTLLGFAKVTRDITEQKHTQLKIDQQREALHQSQKLEAIGRLTGSVAHDFNNFLAIIRTAAELLDAGENLTPEKQARYV
ncbi:MAG TPA: PAS domain S-box protein, partial [Burkholderiaceae bacterium]|nr:PAS domain S-box protein [Burkholderiaceae bacterium]